MKKLIVVIVLGVSCQSSSPSSKKETNGTTETEVAESSQTIFQQRIEILEKSTITGVVAVKPEAVLYRSLSAAEAGDALGPFSAVGTQRSDGTNARFALVVEDNGLYLKVVATDPKIGPTLTPGYEVEVWVHRRALFPVLSESIEKKYSDGTGYTLRSGVPVEFDASTIRVKGLLRELPVEISPDQVTYGFAPMSTHKTVDGDGTLLGCVIEDSEKSTSTVPMNEIVSQYDKRRENEKNKTAKNSKVAEPVQKTRPSINDQLWGELKNKMVSVSQSCRLIENHRSVGMHGNPLNSSFHTCKDFVDTYRTPNGIRLSITFPRATILVSSDMSQLSHFGGCPTKKMVETEIWLSNVSAPVFWSDGSSAGVSIGRKKLKLGNESGDLVCEPASLLNEPICHRKKELTKKLSFEEPR